MSRSNIYIMVSTDGQTIAVGTTTMVQSSSLRYCRMVTETFLSIISFAECNSTKILQVLVPFA